MISKTWHVVNSTYSFLGCVLVISGCSMLQSAFTMYLIYPQTPTLLHGTRSLDLPGYDLWLNFVRYPWCLPNLSPSSFDITYQTWRSRTRSLSHRSWTSTNYEPPYRKLYNNTPMQLDVWEGLRLENGRWVMAMSIFLVVVEPHWWPDWPDQLKCSAWYRVPGKFSIWIQLLGCPGPW